MVCRTILLSARLIKVAHHRIALQRSILVETISGSENLDAFTLHTCRKTYKEIVTYLILYDRNLFQYQSFAEVDILESCHPVKTASDNSSMVPSFGFMLGYHRSITCLRSMDWRLGFLTSRRLSDPEREKD